MAYGPQDELGLRFAGFQEPRRGMPAPPHFRSFIRHVGSPLVDTLGGQPDPLSPVSRILLWSLPLAAISANLWKTGFGLLEPFPGVHTYAGVDISLALFPRPLTGVSGQQFPNKSLANKSPSQDLLLGNPAYIQQMPWARPFE